MPRLTRQESHALTREKIIAAARKEIAEKGVQAASVRSIAEAAGFSQGAFYSSFDCKEAVLLRLLQEQYASVLARFATVPDRIEAKLKTQRGRAVARLIEQEMDVFFASTNPGTTYASVAIELQMHANRSAAFARYYEKARGEFQTALGQIMTRVLGYLPRRPDMEPEHLVLALISTGVGFSTMGPALSPDDRRQILSTFFSGIVRRATI